ncbi:hypothetical protein ACFCXH_23520 [Streptomyces nojiriensis]|uniref:hypothetical protein n=1 Tax=Streptomyces nojiriensis TaxID=66374 RepID=UPI0035DF6AB7
MRPCRRRQGSARPCVHSGGGACDSRPTKARFFPPPTDGAIAAGGRSRSACPRAVSPDAGAGARGGSGWAECRARAFPNPGCRACSRRNSPRQRQSVPVTDQVDLRSQLPAVGRIRVRELVPRNRVRARYAQINRFEKALADDGVTVVKVFLHISYEEQRARLLERLDNPDEHWKFNVGDIEERSAWPAYQEAYEVALERCSTDAAPWYVVPADRKWYRSRAISTLLRGHLQDIDPQYPKGDFDVEECRRRLLEG